MTEKENQIRATSARTSLKKKSALPLARAERKPLDQKKKPPRATSARTSLKKKPALPLARAERKPLDQKKKTAPRCQREIPHKRGTITMQNIDLICVGKLNAKYFAEGVAEYQKRLAAFASFRIVELPEEKIEEKNASDAVVKKALDKEGRTILGSVRRGAAIVALCIEGKQISSEELAQFLADRANSGAGDVAFVIGSSHGLSDEVKRAAALRFSMGRITMPHQLARLVLTEQIYRACTINAGMKYHK